MRKIYYLKINIGIKKDNYIKHINYFYYQYKSIINYFHYVFEFHKKCSEFQGNFQTK